MLSIRIWKKGGYNAKAICIKYNNFDRTVTYNLSSKEYFNNVIPTCVIHPVFQHVGLLWVIDNNNHDKFKMDL